MRVYGLIEILKNHKIREKSVCFLENQPDFSFSESLDACIATFFAHRCFRTLSKLLRLHLQTVWYCIAVCIALSGRTRLSVKSNEISLRKAIAGTGWRPYRGAVRKAGAYAGKGY